MREQINERAPLYLVGFILISAAGAVIFFHLATISGWLQSRELRRNGQETTARVLDLDLSRQPRSVDRCQVFFEYDTEQAGPLEADSDVSSDFCQIFSPGSEVNARYLRDNPAVVQLVWGSMAEDRFIYLMFFDGLIAVWLFFKIMRYRRGKRPV